MTVEPSLAHVSRVRPPGEVAAFSAQQEESITADEMHLLRQTVSYEVLCGVGARVRRVAVE
jgi:alanine racemase